MSGNSFDSPRARFADSLAGSALALFAGDALGAPVEGRPHPWLMARGGWVAEMRGSDRFPAGTYTDDTQLMVGLLQALTVDDTLPASILAHHYAGNFQPWRGYGASTGAALAALKAGQAGAESLSRPSYGNGGAMGIAPLGVYFSADTTLAANRALAACRTTHHHPEALAGAAAVALSAALMTRCRFSGEKPDTVALIAGLLEAPVLGGSPMEAPLLRLKQETALPAWRPLKRAEWLGRTFGGSLRAVESVPIAIGAAFSAATLREAVEVGVNAGGDTDTQGAMAGGIAGGYFGAGELPPSWLAAMENGPQGRDEVRRLAGVLARRGLPPG